MVSEIEQMVFYVTTENTGPKEREMVQKFVRQMKDALKPHSTWKTEIEVKGCNPYLEGLMSLTNRHQMLIITINGSYL